MKTTKSYVIPYLIFGGIFIILPCLILLFLTFNSFNIINFTNFKFSAEFVANIGRSVVLKAIWASIELSVITTIICLLIGYPTALFLTTLSDKLRALFMALLVLPLWSNQVLRIFSWKTVFEMLLKAFPNLNLFNEVGIVIVMVSMYLPFMIAPIYSVLEKQDKLLIEASRDLGASRIQTFFKVTLPLSIGGIISGIVMTLLPALTAFEAPYAISNGTIVLVGNIIYSYIGQGSAGYNYGSALSLFIMIFSIIGFIMVLKVDKEGETLL